MSTATPVNTIPPLDHDEAMALAKPRSPGCSPELASQSGELRLTEMTALQVREHADLTTEQLRQALHQTAVRGQRPPGAARRTPHRPVRLRTAR